LLIAKSVDSLEEALSCVTPDISYANDASTSLTTTSTGGNPPIEVVLWGGFFDTVNGHPFDKQEPKFDKPQFTTDFQKLRNKEDLRGAFAANICWVLNKLTGPEYEFCRWQDRSPGIPDFACTYNSQTILCIEIKRGRVLGKIGGIPFPEFYQSSPNARSAIQQIYNYMCDRKHEYGVLSTYENHWFLRRPDEARSKLFVSETLPSSHESPTVLKAYAYIVMQARHSPSSSHPNIITVPVSEGSDNTTQNKRLTRSMVPKGKDSTQGSSSTTSANQPNQLNLSYADFRFKGILGFGRSGKTLLCEFRGDEIALKIADLYKTPPDILKEMQKEAQIYIKDLKDIQGKYIPKLACYGYYGGGWCYAIGTTIVGTHLSHDNKIPKQQKPRALKALYEIHNRGVLHNDIRKENILLDSVGCVYLIDFGMARRLDPKTKRKLFDEEIREFSSLLDSYTV
jgi:predicted Ser/Thr protein kinase